MAGWDYLHAIDVVREPDRDTSTEVVNDGGSMGGGVKFCFDDFEFKLPHVLWEIVIAVDSGISEPDSGFSSGVGVQEGGLEVFDEVGEIYKGGGV